MAAPAVPDLIQAVLGFRTWSVDADGWLLPFSLGAVAGPWRPGINAAVCHYAKWRSPNGGSVTSNTGVSDATRVAHAAPDPRCMCGLYALADASDPRLPSDDAIFALGAVGAWGDLEVTRAGFRAEFATVLALAVSPRAAPHLRRRHERAAARYGVELVTPELLEVTGLRHAAPVPAALLPGVDAPGLGARPRPRSQARRPAPVAGRTAPVVPTGRGFRIDDHTWLDAASLRCGITRAFAGRLGHGPVDLTLPAVATLHRTSDALAHVTGATGETLRVWTPLTARVTKVNPRLEDDPDLLLRDPEGDGWLATLVPEAWAQEAGGLEWGPRGAIAYRGALTAPDPWADLRATAVHVRSAAEVLAELRRRRSAPRFADAGAVEAELVAPLRRALAGDPEAASALARLGRRVAFVLHDPDAGFVLHACGTAAHVGGPATSAPPRTADLTLRLSAEAAERLLAGRLDVARALRAGELRSDGAPAATLAVASVLSTFPRIRTARVTEGLNMT